MIGAMLSHSFLIPAPTFTADQLEDQAGRVHMVTGGYSGIGYELTKLLFSRNATVFIAGRDAKKAQAAIGCIKTEISASRGRLEFLFLDLADLSTIESSVDDFNCRSDRLDVLVNNAGVMAPGAGEVSAQGHELQMGVNCLGPHLLTQLLSPKLCKTAGIASSGSVRVLWAGSIAVELAPPGGIPLNSQSEPALTVDQAINYSVSKVGNIFLAVETGRRLRNAGVVSLAVNPGNLRTELQRNMVLWQYTVARLILYPSKLGAYTYLFAGWSPAAPRRENDVYVVPWGRVGQLREDIDQATKPGNGCQATSEIFWSWCDRMVAHHR